MNTLDVWYARVSVGDLQQLLRAQGSSRQRRQLEKTVAKGRRKDSARALTKLAVSENGDARIRADPPLIVPIADLVDRSRPSPRCTPTRTSATTPRLSMPYSPGAYQLRQSFELAARRLSRDGVALNLS
jgi:hypothetical protein